MNILHNIIYLFGRVIIETTPKLGAMNKESTCGSDKTLTWIITNLTLIESESNEESPADIVIVVE